jgi:hypothetical protein
MYAAELAVKEQVAQALHGVVAADAAAAASAALRGQHDGPSTSHAASADVPHSREELTVWLTTWMLSPMLNTRRLEEIDALVAEDIKSLEQ